MPRIHILGASGSGTTTLARAVAERLGILAFDTDDVYWLPTEPPFQEKRPAAERLALLRAELRPLADWVLAGSLCGWGDALIPQFNIVVLLEIDAGTRLERLRARERSRYGPDRIAPGGDQHARYTAFLDWASRYESGGMEIRSRQLHEAWVSRLPSDIQVLRLNSDQSLDDLVRDVVHAAAR